MKLGDQVGGKYKIAKSLGGGAFGEVFLAIDLALASEKAIKILSTSNPSETLQKLQEARILDRCRHKNIVQINEANLFNIDGKTCVVLDLEPLPDGSIESELAARWFSIKESCQRVSEMLAGLQYAHSNGYLHRDIKPANILIDGAATKLSDFGLATGAPDRLGSCQGYLPHCPPEFYITGQTNVQTDVFSSGVTLFRVVNNIVDWRNRLNNINNWQEHVRKNSLLKKIGFDHHIPARIKRIINKACSTNVAIRHQSAAALKADIDALRYHIGWIKDKNGQWIGEANTDQYSFTLKKRRLGYEIIFLKNNRRDSRFCRSVSNENEIEGAVAGIVAHTTLRQ